MPMPGRSKSKEDTTPGTAAVVSFTTPEKVPPAVVSFATPETAATLGLFAELVDRTLSEVGQVFVAEHTRILHELACVPNNGDFNGDFNGALVPSWNLRSASQVAAVKLPGDFSMVPNLSTQSTKGTSDSNSTWQKVSSHWSQTPDSNARERLVDSLYTSEASLSRNSKAGLSFIDHIPTEESRASKLKKHQELSKDVWERLVGRAKNEPLAIIEAVMGFVILANALAIGVSCDARDWKTGWLIVDSIFAVIFIIEFFLKVHILGLHGYLCGHQIRWAWFELLLVVFSVAEIVTTIMISGSSSLRQASYLRVVRLLRLTKLLRLGRVHMAPDLLMMVNGLIGGARTLLWAILLTLFPLSIFCLVMRETLGEESGSGSGAESFDSVPKAGFTTFRCLVVEDCADETGRPIFVLVCDKYGWFYGFLYSMTLVFMKFGMYNVIIAIFVEQIVQAAKYDETFQKRARLSDHMMFHEKSLEMAELAYSLKKGINFNDVVCNLTIEEIESLELSSAEFNELCTNDNFKELLSSLDVAEEDHFNLFDTLDVDGSGSLDLGEIVSGIGKLRGDARKSDIVGVMLLAKHLSRGLTDFKEETAIVLREHQRQLSSIQIFLNDNQLYRAKV